MKLVELKIGSIVKVTGKEALQVVVSCGFRADKSFNGEYLVYEFTTIEHPDVVNPMCNKYYLTGYTMEGRGNAVTLDDVTILGECDVTKKFEVTYFCSKAVMY